MSPFARLLFLLPGLGLFLLFLLLPAAWTVVESLHRTADDGSRQWVGLYYYESALEDPALRQALQNNLAYFLWTALTEVGLGLLLALALERPGREWLRVAFFSPIALSLVVAGLLSGFLFKGVGPLAGALEPGRAVLTIALVSGWAYAGFYMVIFLAALAAIPRELEEAARLDGASGLQVVLHLKLPLLRRTIGIALLLCFAGAFRAFDLFWVMLGQQEHGRIVSTLLVQQLTQFDDRGYGSTLAVLLGLFVTCALGLVELVRRLGGRGAAHGP